MSSFSYVLLKVSFALKQGQTIGVIGESGSGKTTLGMAVLGLLGDSIAQIAGEVNVLGKDWQSLKPVERRAMRAPSSQVIFQDPFGSLSPRMSVLQIIFQKVWMYITPKLSRPLSENLVSSDMLKEAGYRSLCLASLST
jgi:microcin C transport system ATP-binding protein